MSEVYNRTALNRESCGVEIHGNDPPKSSRPYITFRKMILNCCLCKAIVWLFRTLKMCAVKTACWCINNLKNLMMCGLRIIGINRQQNRNTKDEEYEFQIGNLERSISDLRRREENLIQALNQEKQEKENALSRLSAVAGDRLRLNNPGIADLSDEYRPNKVAEKFSELYDNEWTEYYEDLERTGSKEEDIIWQLLQLIQDTFTMCKQLAENQRKNLINAVAHPGNSISESGSPPEGILIKVIDFQKRTAAWALEDLKKKIMDKFMDLSDSKSKAKSKYIERCVQLCWMMAIQDPPMYLDFKPEKNALIDKNVYKMFTKSGELMDFMVWPAVFLHQDGPLVQKGVIQPI